MSARLIFLDGHEVTDKNSGGSTFIYAEPIPKVGSAADFGAIDLDIVYRRKTILPAYLKHTLHLDRLDGDVMVYVERELAVLEPERVVWNPKSRWLR